MRDLEMFLLFTAPLEEAGLTHMVTGSVASMVYGEPRLTNDIDIVLDADPPGAARLAALFPASDFYCPPEEVLRVEARRPRRGHFNLIHHVTGFKADVYLCGEDPLHVWALPRRRRVGMGDPPPPPEAAAGRDSAEAEPRRGAEAGELWVAPPEYVIVRKLEFYREGGSAKHLADVRGMLEVSGELVDTAAVDEWVERLGLRRQWDEARGAPPGS